jgi:hypothetical protein
MTDLLIGCPVYKREWILPKWFEHVENACELVGVSPEYVFVADDRDLATLEVISQHKGSGYVFCMQEKEEHDGQGNAIGTARKMRTWDISRYEWMTELRNALLGVVRQVAPKHFLSLDSDILLHPQSLYGMYEFIDRVDAVGSKAYLSYEGKNFPNAGHLGGPSGSLKRDDSVEVLSVEILMAVKLMAPTAYNVDYVSHSSGEDIGWSLACRKQGLRFMWDGRTPNKHVMDRKQLDRLDKRVGF